MDTTSENPTGEMIPTATATPAPIIDANLRTILDLYESNKVAAESEYKSKFKKEKKLLQTCRRR